MPVAVVIPCFRVANQVVSVIDAIGPEVAAVYVVDDACPDGSGKLVAERCRDPRVKVIFHDRNQGVGGATLTGFLQAKQDGATILVKVDGDGQMDPALVPRLIRPIVDGRADVTKGNRFFSPEDLASMPWVRLVGNGCLSFITKVSSGYWSIMDPTNGLLAMHAEVLTLLPVDKLDRRFFFESDLLFRLNTVRAVVQDVPMTARYGDEVSNLKVQRVLIPFAAKHLRSLFKRIVYSYYLRDFNLVSVQLASALLFLSGGTLFGLWHWVDSGQRGTATPTGTVMLAALPIIVGFQLLLSAVNLDIMNEPRRPVHRDGPLLLRAGAPGK